MADVEPPGTTAPGTTTIARRRTPATLIQVGNRQLTSDGRVHPNLLADFIRTRGRTNWVNVRELSKVFTGSKTLDGAKRIRRHLAHVFLLLLAQDEFLVYDTAPKRGTIVAVKLLDITKNQERQLARPQLDRMHARQQLTSTKYTQALEVIERKAAQAQP